MIALRVRTKLTVWFSVSLLLILAPFVAGFVVLEWRFLREALDHHLAEDLEVAIEMLLVKDGQVTWRTDAARDLGYDGSAQRWVEVFALDGRRLYTRGLPTAPHIQDVLPSAAKGADGLESIRTPAGARVRLLTVTRPIAGFPLRVRVARAEDELVEDMRRLLLVFLISIPLGVAAAAAAGHVVSGRMLKPISDMAAQARSISADRLAERLPVENPSDELGQLATVFNSTFGRLEESFDRLKRFSADASHELRTPLTAIRSVGEIGLREGHDAEGYREIIGSMLEEADRLGRLVEELLMLSRWEGGRAQPALQSLDLARLTSEVADQLAVLAEERQVAVEVSFPGPLMIRADATMLRQAVVNVLDNAIKYTRLGSAVRIWSNSSATHHHLAVDDEGPGIPEEHRAFVAERFYRIDDGRAREVGGTGLGLSITERALTVHGGRLEIDANPAGGARIWLVFPRADAPAGS
jgi:heavy metal sensor kinase